MAFNFGAPQWDTNTSTDKVCKELFDKGKDFKTLVKTPKKRKIVNTQEVNPENVYNKKKKKKRDAQHNTNQFKTKKMQKTKVPEVKSSSKHIKFENALRKKIEKGFKTGHFKEEKNNPDKKLETNLHDHSEKLKKINKKETKLKKAQVFNNHTKITYQPDKLFTVSRKQKSTMSLRERMLEKLKGARFRYLNEQMYTKVGHDSKKYFEQNPSDYKAYHEGYRQQVSRWPVNPLDIIIEKVRRMPKNYVIADFGCGEAKLAKSVTQRVHSFDLVAVDDNVVACDMCHVPLESSSVDVVVFCLSLMGTNLKDYIWEAARVLKTGGMLKIAEVESRFDNIDTFIKNIQKYGFVKPEKDLSHDLFVFLDFIKKEGHHGQRSKLPDIQLNPCLYKRR